MSALMTWLHCLLFFNQMYKICSPAPLQQEFADTFIQILAQSTENITLFFLAEWLRNVGMLISNNVVCAPAPPLVVPSNK